MLGWLDDADGAASAVATPLVAPAHTKAVGAVRVTHQMTRKSYRYINIQISRKKFMDLGTPLGLAFASGINTYLPLLSFAVSARFFHLYKINPTFAFITQDWFLSALVILTLIDFIADKIPVIDHTWDAIHTVIRPIAGALVAAASYNHFHLPGTKISAASSYIPQAMLSA